MGSQSSGRDASLVPRIHVHHCGFILRAEICVPRAHAHAAWLLPWVEALLQGRSLDAVSRAPPWPSPPEPSLARYMQHALIDLGWVVPEWTGPAFRVADSLAEAWHRGGRAHLARVLFEADVERGEWWADGLSGVLLSRAVAARFDWDGRRRADAELRGSGDVLELVARAEPDLADLLQKLGGVSSLGDARDQAFLATPFAVESTRDLFFPLFGEEARVLPDELAELEPVLRAHAPHLLGRPRVRPARVVRLPRSPLEPVIAEVERLPASPVELGPVPPVQARLAALRASLDTHADAIAAWLSETEDARVVSGPTQRHFDAVAEVCGALPDDGATLLVTTAFLNPHHAGAEGGLGHALALAPRTSRFLVVYGHASDDLPAEQRRDANAWLATLYARREDLRGRVHVSLGARRSHEKVLIASTGDWMLGSWNAGSSRPGAALFEASLAGRSARFARTLLERLAPNVEDDIGQRLVRSLGASLAASTGIDVSTVVGHLRRAIDVVTGALPGEDGSRDAAWSPAVRALRAAVMPLRSRVRFTVVDEHQTRDALLGLVSGARRDLLVGSDRLAEGGLDRALLADLRRDRPVAPLLRLAWGREWAGALVGDVQAREQRARARRAVRAAREEYGDALLASDEPMENHAKVVVVDGARGLVTSENVLSYGGEKGARESRELGLVFWSPAVARQLVGALVHRWPHVLSAADAGRAEAPLAWAVAANEGWHALAAVAGELEFDWQSPRYVQAALADEVQQPTDDPAADRARKAQWAALGGEAEGFLHVREEAERLGMIRPGEHWIPWDARELPRVECLLLEAERAVGVLPARVASAPRAAAPALVERVSREMVRVPAGSFWMGDDRVACERPRHLVHVTRPFLLAVVPVTQELWREVMGSLPHLRDTERDPRVPIVEITHEQMLEFVSRLNAAPGGGGFMLPTEAQWEYACRAGSAGVYCFGDDPGHGPSPGHLERFAWTKRNAGGRARPVGMLEPNHWGLFDMHGLVYEACRDPMRRYTRGEVSDPEGRPGDGKIAARGGSWGRFPLDHRDPAQEHFRSASRQWYEKSHRVSFRLARALEGP